MHISINDILISLSMAVDFAERDILSQITNHNKKVALTSGKIGRAFGMAEEEIFDLYSYGLLHDNGFAMHLLEPGDRDWHTAKTHTTVSEHNIKNFPFLKKRDNILLYHHEHYDGTGFWGIKGEEIPLFSQIIFLADVVDVEYRTCGTTQEIVEHITALAGVWFSKKLVDIWLEIQSKPNFWLDMDDQFIDRVVTAEVPTFYLDLEYADLLVISDVFSQMVDSKSPFTGNHSAGIAEKAKVMSQYYGFDQQKTDKLTIAAHLHDIGKLVIPSNILDKKGSLSNDEFIAIKQHPYFTRRVLENIHYFEEITEWASNHHEKLNGTGYPYCLTAERLDFCSRLVAVLDIYQALTEDRPYRSGLPHDEAMKILNEMVDKGELDIDIVKDLNEVFAHH